MISMCETCKLWMNEFYMILIIKSWDAKFMMYISNFMINLQMQSTKNNKLFLNINKLIAWSQIIKSKFRLCWQILFNMLCF
jgi:hypothetical protein